MEQKPFEIAKDRIYDLLKEAFPNWKILKDDHGWREDCINCHIPDEECPRGFFGNLLFGGHNDMISITCPCWNNVSPRFSEFNAEDLKRQVRSMMDHQCCPWPG